MDLVALRAELDSGHPDTGAYNVDDALAAIELNVINRTRMKPGVTGSEILNATDDAEYTALTTQEKKDSWLILCAIEFIDTNSGVAKALEADTFGGGTATRANLAALRIENISRATELGFTNVRTGTVQSARAL